MGGLTTAPHSQVCGIKRGDFSSLFKGWSQDWEILLSSGQSRQLKKMSTYTVNSKKYVPVYVLFTYFKLCLWYIVLCTLYTVHCVSSLCTFTYFTQCLWNIVYCILLIVNCLYTVYVVYILPLIDCLLYTVLCSLCKLSIYCLRSLHIAFGRLFAVHYIMFTV